MTLGHPRELQSWWLGEGRVVVRGGWEGEWFGVKLVVV